MAKTMGLALLLVAFFVALVFAHGAQADPGPGSATASNILYQDWKDEKRGRDIPIKIYLPRGGAKPYPVVIFSHGLGGSREAAVYLGDYWSQHGYLCVFVQHPGSDSAVWQPARGAGREAILERMKAAANGKNLVDRAQDIKFVLDELELLNEKDPHLKKQIDLQRIALAGHSFGAGTTLAIAGQNFGRNGHGLEDRRVKAAIYLCPPVGAGKSAPVQTYGSIEIPGMLLTGTEDNSPISETKAEDRRIPFDGMKAPHQYLVNFAGADHSTFGGGGFRAAKESDEKFHEMIDQLTTEFLDATLKGDASAWQWLDAGGAVAYLGKTAVFEKK